MLLEAEGDDFLARTLPLFSCCWWRSNLAVAVSVLRCLLCCAWGNLERGAEGGTGVEGELFHVSSTLAQC